MRPIRSLQCVRIEDKARLITALSEQGFKIFEFDGSGVTDKETFFRQAAVDLPQPPELVARSNWDALSDNLWSTLLEPSSNRHAILWSHPDRLYTSDLETFMTAVMVLTSVMEQLQTDQTMSYQLILVFTGTGQGFRPFDG